VFGYNFPHWKTQNGLLNLCCNGFKPDLVILQNKKEIKHNQSKFNIVPKGQYLQEPSDVCKALGLEYIVLDHDDKTLSDMLYDCEFDVGVILGARILKKHTIEAFSQGIINMHPAILPDNRGLDNIKWAIFKNLPIGVTVHWIDEKIDMGSLILKDTIKLYKNDELKEVVLRNQNLEQELLIKALKHVSVHGFEYNPLAEGTYFKCVHDGIDVIINSLFNAYLSNYLLNEKTKS
jgi:methionyl-tRNA formyltransferase